MFRRYFFLLTSGILIGCGSEPTTPRTDTPSASVVVAPMTGVAGEFSKRIAMNVGGTLQSMSEADGRIVARWKSGKCDWMETEVIDLLLSINREFRGRLTRIDGQRECENQSRLYTLSGADFDRYRAGIISDAEVLKGIAQ